MNATPGMNYAHICLSALFTKYQHHYIATKAAIIYYRLANITMCRTNIQTHRVHRDRQTIHLHRNDLSNFKIRNNCTIANDTNQFNCTDVDNNNNLQTLRWLNLI